MEPTQNISGVNTAPEAQTQPTSSEPVFRDAPKKNLGVMICMICLAILAAGGIGFGVWAMMDKNNQVDDLNKQISSLKAQNDELQSQVDELQEQADNGGFYEILPPQWGEAEAVVEDGLFTIYNADGEVYTQLDDYVVDEIISCDSGTADAPAPMTCIVTTPEGEATIIYDFDEQSIEYIGSTD